MASSIRQVESRLQRDTTELERRNELDAAAEQTVADGRAMLGLWPTLPAAERWCWTGKELTQLDNLRFIEAVGEAERTARVSLYHAKLRISLHDDAATAHQALDRLEQLKSRALTALAPLSALGVSAMDGGSELNRYERRRKDPVGVAAVGLTLRESGHLTEVMRVVEAAVGLDEAVAVMVNLGRPEFEPIDRKEALLGAMADARSKAEGMAMAGGGKLGPVLSAIEMSPRKRDSGALGDPDYWGDEERFHIGGGSPKDEAERPTRTYFLFVRVRFELLHAAAQQQAED